MEPVLDNKETKEISNDVRKAFRRAKKDNNLNKYLEKKVNKKGVIISFIIILLIFALFLMAFFKSNPAVKAEESIHKLINYLKTSDVSVGKYNFSNNSLYVKNSHNEYILLTSDQNKVDNLLDYLDKDLVNTISKQKTSYSKIKENDTIYNKVTLNITNSNKETFFSDLENNILNDNDLIELISSLINKNDTDTKAIIRSSLEKEKTSITNIKIDILYNDDVILKVDDNSIMSSDKVLSYRKYEKFTDLN